MSWNKKKPKIHPSRALRFVRLTKGNKRKIRRWKKNGVSFTTDMTTFINRMLRESYSDELMEQYIFSDPIAENLFPIIDEPKKENA